MKALDKVFDTQVIMALLVINFISLKQKKISYMKKEENRQEDGIKGTIVTEEINGIYQSQK